MHISWPSFIAAVVVLAAAAFGYRESGALGALRTQIVVTELQPIATLLRENAALTQELRSERFKKNNSGAFESYLAKIRRDGVPMHADMKQRLDTLAENNTAIATLIKAYAPHAKTPAFATESDKFIRHFESPATLRDPALPPLLLATRQSTSPPPGPSPPPPP